MEFELNKEKLEELTKGYSKKDLNINCKVKDDIILIALLIKYYKLEYKCSVKGCDIKNSWNKKAIKLYLARKNNKKKDCRKDNLELCCYNCYFQKNNFNFDLFLKIKKKEIKECKVCFFTLNKLPKLYRDMKVCIMCYETYYKNRVKIKSSSNSSDDEQSDEENNEESLYIKKNRNIQNKKKEDSIKDSIDNLKFSEFDINSIKEDMLNLFK